MPITKSAKKALKVSKRRQAENLLMKQEIKNRVKGFRIAINSSGQDAAESLSQAFSALDKAAKKKLIHKNKASRLKSRLAKAGVAAGSKIDTPKKKTVSSAKTNPKIAKSKSKKSSK